MRGTPKIAGVQLLLVIPFIILLNTGCLTRSLWEAEIHEPAVRPNLSLAAAPDRTDVLVQYNEHQSDKVRRRSYWLFEYEMVKGGAGKPRFVRPKSYADMDLTPIPLSEQGTKENAVPAAGFVAVPKIEERSFELQRDGVALGHFGLPIYQVDAKPTFGRVALTPLAAAADGVIAVGAAASVVGGVVLIGYLESAESSDDVGGSCPPKHKNEGLRATHQSD